MSKAPYLIYKELVSSTCIDISIIFRSINENNELSNYLLIGTTSTISIYEINEKSQSIDSNTTLTLVLYEKTFGKPQDVKIITNFSKDNDFIEDILIISFDIAKYVKAKYNPLLRKLSILNIYNIEENAIGLGSINRVQYRYRTNSIGNGSIPLLAVNQSNGLICSIVYGQLLYFISNRKDILLLSNNNRIKNKITTNKISYPLESQLQNEFIIDIQIILKLYGPILDICFINGYNKPALAVLQDTGLVPIGHLLKVKHTCQVSILAVDELTQNVSILWKKSAMPHDSLRILPYNNYLSIGLFVISMNGVLYITETDVNSIGTNAFANVSINSNHKMEISSLAIPLELDCSNWILVKDNVYIGSLKDGYIISIKFINNSFDINAIGQSIYSSCFTCSYNEKFWFIGSRHQDSILFNVSILSTNGLINQSTSKRQRRQSKVPVSDLFITNDSDILNDIKTEEISLYNNVIDITNDLSHNNITYEFILSIADTIVVIPSIVTGLICKYNDIFSQINQLDWSNVNKPIDQTIQSSPASYISETESRNNLIVTAGGLVNAIYKLGFGINYNKLASRTFLDVTSICSIVINQSTFLFLSYNNSTKVFEISNDLTNKPIDVIEKPLDHSSITIKEVSSDIFGYISKEKTILSSVIYSNSRYNYIIQIFQLGIRLVKSYINSSNENEALQDIIISDSDELGGLNSPTGDQIVTGDINSNNQYVVILTSCNYVYVLKFDLNDEYISCIHTFEPTVHSYIVNVSLFHGYIPDISTNKPFDLDENKDHDKSTNMSMASLIQSIESDKLTIDELIKAEEMFLYNQPIINNSDQSEDKQIDMQVDNETNYLIKKEVVDKPYLVVVTNDSVVNILSIGNQFSIIGSINNINESKDIIYTQLSSNHLSTSIDSKVINCRLEWIGSQASNHLNRYLGLITLLDNGDLIIYQAIIANNYLSYWLKFKHTYITRPKKLVKNKKSNNVSYRLFVNIDGSNNRNVVISGLTQPLTVKSTYGYPIVLPLTLPELPYNNSGIMHVSTLSLDDDQINGIVTLWVENTIDDYNNSSKLNYNNKQSLLGFYIEQVDTTIIPGNNITYHKINNNSNNCIINKFIEINKNKIINKNELQLFQRKTYLITCYNNIPSINYRSLVLTDNEKTKIENDDFYYYFSDIESFYQPLIKNNYYTKLLYDKQYKIILLQYNIVIFEYFLPENEVILDIDIIYLSNDNNKKLNKSTFIIVGTAILDRHGEDCPSDGRLLLFSIDYTRFDNTTNNTIENLLQPKLNLISSAIGPVSVVKQFGNDRILATVGPTVFIYKLDYENMSLEQISFYFSKFYISSVSIVKNLIYISDYGNHVDMLLWQEDDWSLTLLSKDYTKHTYNRCINTIHDQAALAVVISDDEKNIRLMQYSPLKEIESYQGAKLLCLADFHIGSEISLSLLHPVLSPLESSNTTINSVNSFNQSKFRMISQLSGQPFASKLNKNTSNKSCNVIGTLDGQVGILLPINEQVFKRLNLLQHMISMTTETFCLLNPKDYRTYKTNDNISIDRKKGILDGNLLYKFIGLDSYSQIELATSLGTTVDVILENLYDIDIISCFF